MRGIPGLLESLLRPQLLSPANAIGAPYLIELENDGREELNRTTAFTTFFYIHVY